MSHNRSTKPFPQSEPRSRLRPEPPDLPHESSDSAAAPRAIQARLFHAGILATTFLLLLLSGFGVSAETGTQAAVIVVAGAGGDEEYATAFSEWSQHWVKAAGAAGAKLTAIGLDEKAPDAPSDKEALKGALEAEAKNGGAELWIVLLGHGTYDRRTARFNLRGEDLGAGELADWLRQFRRPTAVVVAASASGPFVSRLAAPDRVVVTATKSGDEINFARFGRHFSEAINDLGADLDKDGQTSLLEAWLTASRQVDEWYESEGRIATEHALLDDNGDGKGTPASWFRGIRAVKQAKDGTSLDGARAHQFHLIRSEQERRMPLELRARRDRIELEVVALRQSKQTLSEEAYYARLEPLLLQLARLYREAAAIEADAGKKQR